jgi:capsular exopolysaccharide synthesis family protein
MLNLLLGLLGGLAAGVAAAFLVEQIDNTVDTPEKLERILGGALLGVVPRAEMAGVGEPPVDGPGSGAGGNGFSPELICLHDVKSRVSEAYRSIRTAIQFAGSAGRPVRSFAVVSAAPQEGKTLTAVNLAIAMAQAGHRVLMIDADLRRPRLHKILCPGHEAHARGLSNVLIGEVRMEDVARETMVPGLWCIPSGPIPPNPSELLGSPRMAELLQAALAKYDRVVIDSPPVGAVTDACVIAPHLDGVVQVVGFARTSCSDAREGKDRLVSLGARYLGAILNNVPAVRWRIGRYGMGRYYHRYGDYYGEEGSKG